VSRRAALAGALLTTLATPAIWPMALAGFLLRGGLLIVVLPIVVLPSPVGIGNLLAPTLMTVVFRGISDGVALLVGLLVLAIVGWVILGGLLAAMLEAEAALIVAGEDDASSHVGDGGHPTPGNLDRGVATRILAARVVAHVPTGVAATLGSARLVTLAYHELTSPFDVATPIAVRVIRAAPEVVVAILVAWMAGEILGGLAARRIALDGASTGRALRSAASDAIRHPLAVLLDFWVPVAALVLVAIPSAVAASATWGLVRLAMRSPGEAAAATLAVVLFVALWLIGLVLIAVTVAWRATVWSMAHGELERQRRGLS
jgi:hypothetical protein